MTDALGGDRPNNQAAQDVGKWREIYRQPDQDFYSDSIRREEQTGALRFNSGGRVVAVSGVRAVVDALWPVKPLGGDRLAQLTFREFSEANRTRCEAPNGFNHPLASWSTSDWFVAVMGELGEAANIVKKLNRVRDGVPGNKQTPEELRDRVRQELGDVFVYLDLIAQSLGFSIADAAVEVFNEKSIEIGYSAALRAAGAPPRWITCPNCENRAQVEPCWRCNGTGSVAAGAAGEPPPQEGLLHPVSQVYFRAGLLACREYMARFVEAENTTIAASIRANWWPSLGRDYGPPRQLEFAEVTDGEFETPSFRCRTPNELSPTQEALPIALAFLDSQ